MSYHSLKASLKRPLKGGLINLGFIGVVGFNLTVLYQVIFLVIR